MRVPLLIHSATVIWIFNTDQVSICIQFVYDAVYNIKQINDGHSHHLKRLKLFGWLVHKHLGALLSIINQLVIAIKAMIIAP